MMMVRVLAPLILLLCIYSCLTAYHIKYMDGYMFDFDTEKWTPSVPLPAPNIPCQDFVRMNANRFESPLQGRPLS